MNRAIRSAVFPVAGLGTRLLPATKSIPKEMLTIVDRPAIQMVVDEAREAGIEHFVFVTGRGKSAIEDYFDVGFELEATLLAQAKHEALSILADSRLAPGQASFTRQHAPLGLGHAVGCARQLVGGEPFALLLPDMIMDARPGCLKEMMRVYDEQGGGNVVALEEVAPKDVSRYGVAGFTRAASGAIRIDQMVEKPSPGEAPSNFIISGRYLLQPEIFDLIGVSTPGAGGEIQLTDAMAVLMARQPFWGYKFEGATYDCGDKLGFLLANAAFGLAHEEIGDAFRQALLQLLSRKSPAAQRSAA
ncbi:MAG: UTP--glucose-1-phosphate uridylyltransferase [Aestuariivirga sp.]